MLNKSDWFSDSPLCCFYSDLKHCRICCFEKSQRVSGFEFLICLSTQRQKCMDAGKNPLAILSISFPPLCVLRLLVAASCIFNVFFFPSCVWWMFDSTSHGLRRIWPYPAQQASKALKYSHPGAAEWNPVPDSLFKVNNAPAVTPSMWPNHINEPCQRKIQRESQGVYVRLCFCFLLCCLCQILAAACLLSQRAKLQLIR